MQHSVTACVKHTPNHTVSSGYGFVDFDSPAAAQKAVAALKTSGIQAQMAKARIHDWLILISNTYKSPSALLCSHLAGQET